MFRKRKPEVDIDDLPEPVSSAAYPFEMSLAVSAALGRLSTDQREAVVLKVYQGFKFEEIAEILDIPVSTVKSRLYTALDLLKTELSPVDRKNAERKN